jgi:hypothetical protein
MIQEFVNFLIALNRFLVLVCEIDDSKGVVWWLLRVNFLPLNHEQQFSARRPCRFHSVPINHNHIHANGMQIFLQRLYMGNFRPDVYLPYVYPISGILPLRSHGLDCGVLCGDCDKVGDDGRFFSLGVC